jgi:hypothetical protein
MAAASTYLDGAKRDLHECLTATTAMAAKSVVIEIRPTLDATALRLQKLFTALQSSDFAMKTATIPSTTVTATDRFTVIAAIEE